MGGFAVPCPARYSKGMTNPRRLTLLAILVLAGTGTLSAAPSPFFSWLGSPQGLSIGSAGILIVNNDPGTTSSDFHLTGGLSASASYAFKGSELLSFEPNILLWRSWYYWTAANKAVPVSLEDRQAWVLGILLDFPIAFTLPLGKAMDFTASGGLCLNLRLGIKADATVSDSAVSSINAYLWSAARFILPTTAAGLSLRINDNLKGRLGLKAYWPISNLWSGEGLGFLDQTMVALNLSLAWRPKHPQTEP